EVGTLNTTSSTRIDEVSYTSTLVAGVSGVQITGINPALTPGSVITSAAPIQVLNKIPPDPSANLVILADNGSSLRSGVGGTARGGGAVPALGAGNALSTDT